MRGLVTAFAMAALVVLAGCAGRSETEGKVEGEGKANEKVTITGIPLKPGEPLPDIVNTVYFEYDKAALTPEALPILAGVAQWMKRYPDVQVQIAGHADERGTREYNLALGNLRAVAVKNYLVALGTPAQRLSTVSYGKERPAVVGSSEEAWSKNRRAVAGVE